MLFPVLPVLDDVAGAVVLVPLVCASSEEADIRNTAAIAAARGCRFMLAPFVLVDMGKASTCVRLPLKKS
jgi:hypothetical protein